VYLHESYNEELNEIKLSKLVKELKYNEDRVYINEDQNLNKGELAMKQFRDSTA